MKAFNAVQNKAHSSYQTTVHSVEAQNPVAPAPLLVHHQIHVLARPLVHGTGISEKKGRRAGA